MTSRFAVVVTGTLLCVATVVGGSTLTRRRAVRTHDHVMQVEVQSQGGAVPQLPIAVDGAKHPELIPDELAYRQFLRLLATHGVPSPEESERQSLLLARLGLSRTDQQAVIGALTSVRERLDSLQQRRAELNDPFLVQSNKAEEDTLMANARIAVANALSPDGAQRLDEHIQRHVKTCIVIYGQMSQ